MNKAEIQLQIDVVNAQVALVEKQRLVIADQQSKQDAQLQAKLAQLQAAYTAAAE